jgi:type 1 fimbria pilin
MKRPTVVAAIVLACAALVAPRASAEDKKGKVTVTGEVIDSACYIKMGAKGESHRDCAQKCGDAGIPLALLEDGTNSVIWLASVADMETPNAKLRPHAGRKVIVTGTYAERGGAKILLVESVQAVKR